MKLSTLFGATAVSAALLLTGCSNSELKEQTSGFLTSYDNLEEKDGVEHTKMYIAKDADFTKYENIYVAPVQIISQTAQKNLTTEQVELHAAISTYLTDGYIKNLQKNKVYTLVQDKNTPNTLVFEAAISAVAINYDDLSWYQYTPITLAVTGVARASFVSGNVRVLGEGRFTDSDTSEVLMRAVSLQKGEEVKTAADKLTLKDVKPALDAWLKRIDKNLVNLNNGSLK